MTLTLRRLNGDVLDVKLAISDELSGVPSDVRPYCQLFGVGPARGTSRIRMSSTTGLRIAHPWRILVLPRASALGSGPGCPPFGGGAGFCALRPKVCDVVDERLDHWQPPTTSSVSPGDGICNPQQRLACTPPVIKDQRWF